MQNEHGKWTDLTNVAFAARSANDVSLTFLSIPPNFKQQHGEGTDRSGSPTAAEISKFHSEVNQSNVKICIFADHQKLLSIHNCSILA